jgi:hypothetical protein
MAKKSKIEMGDYIPKPIEYEAYAWCINNGIKIYPVADSTIRWFVEIDINGKKNRSPDSFEKNVIWQKIWEYYKYYYKKYENKV